MPHQIESIRAMIHPKKNKEVSKIERKAKKQLVVLYISSTEKKGTKRIFFHRLLNKKIPTHLILSTYLNRKLNFYGFAYTLTLQQQ